MKSLRSVPGQRRASIRSAGFQSIPVKVYFSSREYFAAVLEAVDYGRITLRAEELAWSKIKDKEGTLTSVQDEKGDELLDGAWRIRTTRIESPQVVISAELPNVSLLPGLESFVSPQTFLRTNRHRFLQLNAEADVNSISQFFTEIRDCPLPVPGRLRDGERRIPFHFDFSSGRVSLETFDFKMEPDVAALFKTGEKWMADFSFLSVRYLVPVAIVSTDPDWGLVELKFGGFLLAVTNRLHDRHACRIPVKFGTEDEPDSIWRYDYRD